MRAIILAAGVGQRLAPFGDQPKCLLEFDRVTLLERQVANLHALGVSPVVVCVGYRAELVTARLAAIAPAGVETVVNPAYHEGSIVSLWAARGSLCCGDEVLVMDADVLFAPAILERLVSNPGASCVLLDRVFEPGDEPVKICVHAGLVVEFRKHVAPGLTYDYCGESVGFFRFSPQAAAALAAITERYITGGHRAAPHEEAVRELLLRNPRDFAIEDVTGLPWTEIDFPGDVARARDEILPRLHGH